MRITETGLIVNETERSTPGFTLVAPLNQAHVELLDLAGEPVHRWDLKGITGNLAQLLDNGNLLVGELSDEGPPLHNGKGGLMREYDWDGKIVWEYLDPAQHHDLRRLPNGNTLYLGWETMSADAARRVQGGLPGTEHPEGGIYNDYLREVTPAGEAVWEWHFADENIEDHVMHPLVNRQEFAHANACFPMANGDVLVSFRRINTLAIVDRGTKRFRWHHSDFTWGQQHDCQVLDNGNIMLFANGHSTLGFPFSRIVEFDPETRETVWEYKAERWFDFYSPHISGCQRLASGNTLICEGVAGRVFEVTPTGEIVWEYISPHWTSRPHYGRINWVFRAHRYTRDSAQIQNRV